MRQFLCLRWAALFLAAMLFSPGGLASAIGPNAQPSADVDFSVLPPDMEKLRSLDTRHRQLIERTIRRCTGRRGEVPGEDLSASPCVVSGVERVLRDVADPRLSAFHHALPEDVRYDHTRTEMEWQPAVKSRIAQPRPLWGQ